MNPVLYILVALRAAALALGLGGQQKTSDALYALADGIEAGRATDEHMALVADKLKARDITAEDWDDVLARIEADAVRLHGDS